MIRGFGTVGVVSSLLIWACGQGVPDVCDVKHELSRRAASESNGCIRLLEVRKTNGYPAPALREVYVVVFSAEVEFVKACKWRTPMFRPGEHASFQTTITDSEAARERGPWGEFLNKSQNPGDAHPAGAQVRVSGEQGFQATERGFQPVSDLLEMVEEGVATRGASG